MSNASILRSKRDGNWSTPSNLAASPWHGSGFDHDAVTPASVPTGTAPDLGFIVNIDHDVVVDVDSAVGAWYPPADFEPLLFSATAGSMETRLPSGNYRACYATRSDNGLSSIGHTESVPVLLTTGVSKPQIMFPAAPQFGFSYYLYLTAHDGDPGSERIYALDVETPYVDLLTELYNTERSGLTDQVIESVAGSAPYSPSISPPTPHRNCNAITIGPEGSLRIASGVTLTVRGDIWIEGKPDGGHEYIVFGSGSHLLWDYSGCINPETTEYTIWPAGGGHIRFEGPA